MCGPALDAEWEQIALNGIVEAIGKIQTTTGNQIRAVQQCYFSWFCWTCCGWVENSSYFFLDMRDINSLKNYVCI